MRIFQEVPLPPTCYAAEAALWLAVGRVPKILHKTSDIGNDYSESDPRTNREALDEDADIMPFDAGFSEAELRHMGIEETDFERYVKIREIVASRLPFLRKPTGDQVVEAEITQQHMYEVILQSRPEYNGLIPRRINQALQDAMKETVDWANGVDAECDAVIDIARAEIYRALATGEIAAQAWRDEPGKPEGSNTLVAIPAAHWSLRNFDWEESTLHHSSGNYYAVQISTTALLFKFPRPHGSAAPKVVESYPGCLLVDEDGIASKPPTPAQVRRGRREKGDGLIKLAVVNVFGDRARKGDLPEKAEALAQEIMDFVSLAFEETISRSTAQIYIKLLPEMAAKK